MISTVMKPHIGIFGDSYAQSYGTWTERLATLMPAAEVDVQGQGGTNQYYALDRWRLSHLGKSADVYDFAIFTFTWHTRLFHSRPYRNDQLRWYSEQRPFDVDENILDDASNREFLETIPRYFKYIYDDDWARFNHEMILRYMLQDLPDSHPNTKFVFIPNTQISRQIAKKYFRTGILLDFAFEELSNREPGSPGAMPINCGRPGHLGPKNHQLFAEFMHRILLEYDQHADDTVVVDLLLFDVTR